MRFSHTLVRMETKWLEDLQSLAATHSFSRSAQLRHVTQSAFSRRIQSLENWAGVALVDRSSYPPSLTAAGQTLLASGNEILETLQSARNQMRGHRAADQDTIDFAVPHSLAFSFFPHWLMGLRGRVAGLKSRLIAANVHDAVVQLTEGGCDLLLAYHHPSQPLTLGTDRYEMIILGRETLAPYAKADKQGKPVFSLPGDGAAVPFLSYGEGAYLGRLVEQILKLARPPLALDTVYETDMAEGLKAMALEGHGVAFLPASSVRRELKSRRLVRACGEDEPGEHLMLTMEVRIYRERPEVARHRNAAALKLWKFLEDGAET